MLNPLELFDIRLVISLFSNPAPQKPIRIEPSPRQAVGNVLPVAAVLRSTVRIKKSISNSLANPAGSSGECARYRGSKIQLFLQLSGDDAAHRNRISSLHFSDLTWQAFFALGYSFKEWFDMTLGYRHMVFAADDDQLIQVTLPLRISTAATAGSRYSSTCMTSTIMWSCAMSITRVQSTTCNTTPKPTGCTGLIIRRSRK